MAGVVLLLNKGAGLNVECLLLLPQGMMSKLQMQQANTTTKAAAAQPTAVCSHMKSTAAAGAAAACSNAAWAGAEAGAEHVAGAEAQQQQLGQAGMMNIVTTTLHLYLVCRCIRTPGFKAQLMEV